MQFLTVLLYLLLAITSLFLICLVLIQRGKGGGLAGAFGGQGGSSAFGTKAGDVFTRVTMISAAVWISLNMLLVVLSNNRTSAWGPTTTTRVGAKGSEFVPSGKVDLDKVSKPASGTDLAPGVLPPPPAASPGTGKASIGDPTPAPSGSPTTTTAPLLPIPKDATTPAPRP